MFSNQNIQPGGHEIEKQGNTDVLKIYCHNYPYLPSIEDNAVGMTKVIDKLIEIPSAQKIILMDRRNYEYDYDQTRMLMEIANLYKYLIREKKILNLSVGPDPYYFKVNLQTIITSTLKSDPVGAYVELKRLIRDEKIKIEKIEYMDEVNRRTNYLEILTKLLRLFEDTKLISLAKQYLSGHEFGSREIYKQIFKPSITPDFMFTRLMAQPPLHSEEVDAYSIGKIEVNIFKIPEQIQHLYHVIPPEFKLTEEKYELLDIARNALSEHKPQREELIDPERMRQTFYNIGRDLIQELAEQKGIELKYKELNELAGILMRYTVGFGLIEILLEDTKIQDITINGPIGESPIFIVHEDYHECVTNLYPSKEDGESWASKFRILSGRPLDEANPVLDTELVLPKARARVGIMSKPLNPVGLAYAFRRHRDQPWTYPLFIKNKMLNPLAAGLLSFLVDGNRTLLFAGTRSSGKTSLLGSTLVEIMRKYRILTVEDSVTGDSEILIKKDRNIEKTTIGKIIDSSISKYGCWYNLSNHEILGNNNSFEILSMDKKGKIKWTKPNKLIRHKTKKTIYKIKTRTGRIIKVTGDHSLFGLGKKAKIVELKANNLKVKDFIATPRGLPPNYESKKEINILDYLERFDKGFFEGEIVKEFNKKYQHEITQLSKDHKYNKSTKNNWLRKGLLPIKIVKDLNCLGYNIYDLENTKFKVSPNSKSLPVKIPICEDLLAFTGLWLADGCYDKNSIILSVVEEENRKIFKNLSDKYGFDIKKNSDTFSLIINSKTLKGIMVNILELRGNSYTKRIPNWVFNLSKTQISYVLNGIFSGDGDVTNKEISISLCSRKLLEDIQTLLLQFNILLRIGNIYNKDKTYSSRVSSIREWKIFKDLIGILPKHKKDRLNILCLKVSTHEPTNKIPLVIEDKIELCKILKSLNSNDYTKRNSAIGINKLTSSLQQLNFKNELISNLKILLKSDLFFDQIRSIEIDENFGGYVYDFSVPECESFITGNIIAHNTEELPIDALRKLNYNIQPMKVRSALTKTSAEMEADEGIRTSLRFGDSALIVGEIRSSEAKALFEAMRIGALSNVVAGTIHGADPYGVFDRVVNDLEVPRTSFKAVDIIVVSNPIRSADGLHKQRRILSISEVRKHWEDDPLREKGFVDLMKYNVKTDMLEPTQDLINGDSEVIKEIAGNVKEWIGNWQAVWDNIMLRAKIKETLVDYSLKLNQPSILEANFVVESNDMFHRISDSIREELGYLDSKRIFFEWHEWLKRALKKSILQ